MLGILKSTLLGSKLRILLTLVLALGVAGAGAFSLGVLGAPSVAGVQNSFGNVTDRTTEIETDLVVHNPNPIGVSLGDVSVSYDVTMNDVAMANGTKDGVAVGAGNSTVAFRTKMRNDRIPDWWVSHIRNGEHTALEVDAEVRSDTLDRTYDAPPIEREVSTDVISQFNSTETRPVNASQPFVSDPVMYVNETSASWGEVSGAETPIDMRFVVYNPKTMPVAVTEIGYNITMNDVKVGNGTTDREHVIEGHTTETIEAQTAIRNQKLDEWWVTHLENDQVTDLRIEFYAKVEVGGETFRVALDGMTYEKTIETDMFGNKDAAGSANATTDDDSATAADGETATESGTTEEDATAEGTGTTTGDSDGGTTEDSGEGTTTEDDGLLDLDSRRFA